MSNFEIRAKDGLARLGRFSTAHGTVDTPLLMPVVHPGKSAIPSKYLVEKFGFEMVITNSYIISSSEKFREKALKEGVHGLLEFDRPIMTDSGTFQMYFHDLPKEEIDPIEILDFQKKIGSDVGTILDTFSRPDVSRTQVEKDVDLSLERARLSVEMKGEMQLAGTVQGGTYQDLREKSARAMAGLNFDVFPIGGVVPLMEMYRYAEIVRIILAVKKHLPMDRPVHLFGCGHPMFFAQAIYLGCDLFDSASYAKFADSGRMLLASGTVHLNDLRELPCECPICSNTSVTELKSMPEPERKLALMKHNLYVSNGEMKRVRQAIDEGKLFELVALRARSHPALLEALHVMTNDMDQIIQSDPFGKSNSVFYTGPETQLRPEIFRFHDRLIKRYPYRETSTIVIVPDIGARPFSDTAHTITDEIHKHASKSVILLFLTPMGIVPWELEHVHPAQQCIFPETVDKFVLKSAAQKLQDVLDILSFKEIIWFDRASPTNELINELERFDNITKVQTASQIESSMGEGSETNEWVKRKLRAIFSYQWGNQVSGLPDKYNLQVVFSKSTGKIRYVKMDEDILFTMVPTTGLFTPTFKGGKTLLESGISSEYIVVMANDVADFVAEGKSALAKFVVECHDNLLAGEECLAVDESHDLLGVGRALLTGREMRVFQRGVAVNIRHSRKSH